MADNTDGKKGRRKNRAAPPTVEGCLFDEPTSRDFGFKRDIQGEKEGPSEPSPRGVNAFRSL